ncbi:MAG: hypothetical protein UV51_C0010G0030 [Candidatus Woesebacteria bacterium GW2011_GWC1_42_9]|nr:MAG: hypothetical protein UV51_C0010G0030 [Candidatus Woesebacteria bacterium GW2011_GWC1_42_9]
MSHITYLAKKTFNKIFNNLGKELNEDVTNIQLGICYKSGQHFYEAYSNFKKVKNIVLGDYVGAVIDFSGGTEMIDSTIVQSGTTFSKNLNCPLDDISIIMRYRKDQFPESVLLVNGKKEREINIEKDFFNAE